MPNYRRLFVPGGCWFFTVNLLDRRTSLLTDNIDALRAATAWTMRRYPFRIEAFVVLPDHLHAIWTLPEGDAYFSTRWRMIKTRFARALPATERRDETRLARGERGIWQRRFWEHLIRDEDDFGRHVDYCTINPVKHGYVRRVADWPYSSFHRDVRRGLFTEDWGGEIDLSGAFGERDGAETS
jgi:putative transposase